MIDSSPVLVTVIVYSVPDPATTAVALTVAKSLLGNGPPLGSDGYSRAWTPPAAGGTTSSTTAANASNAERARRIIGVLLRDRD